MVGLVGIGALVLVVLFSLDVVSPREKPCPLDSPVIPTPAQIAVASDLFRDECVWVRGTVVFQHAGVLVAEMNRGEFVQSVNVLGPSEVLGAIPLGRVVTLAGRLKVEEDKTYAVHLVTGLWIGSGMVAEPPGKPRRVVFRWLRRRAAGEETLASLQMQADP